MLGDIIVPLESACHISSRKNRELRYARIYKTEQVCGVVRRMEDPRRTLDDPCPLRREAFKDSISSNPQLFHVS